MQTPTVSVIIPCFNARSWLKQTIESVQSQNLEEMETILVDDGSTDGSADLVESEFPFVRVIRTTNGGPSRARNVGTRASSGAYLQYLDADDLLTPGKIRLQVEMLERTGTDVAYGGWQELVHRAAGRAELGKLIERQLGSNLETDLFGDFWCPPAVYMFRKSIVDKVGGWNESLPVIQDARFALDCALHGAAFVHCPGIMAYYRIHSRDTVSRRDPIAFLRDCFRNAEQVEEWWRSHGGLAEERRIALLQVYQQVARGSYRKDAALFEQGHGALNRLHPRYIPLAPKPLRIASRIVGYRKAELMAYLYRYAKGVLIPRPPDRFS